MKLKRVIYELYEVDLVSLNINQEWHEIDREIYLEFEGGEKKYFSWCNKPAQYSVGVQNHRFNTNEPDHVVDASNWNMWQGLIGNEIELISRGNLHQILEIKGQGKSVYLSSQEQGSWLSDVLHISSTLPEFGS
ncbi:hypothetical protein QWZ13_18080 [Reinekea marina]|uniref:Uncharacterized protein n=1 Tax=Reinekea marina TaxID=1310421 RepID=A0ABV7WVC8_9GAMM|nr:hypothetical protein [Reinekea marina]MDN3650809.1 hypothetical protein [Reinekea marina]MDN3650819.1 hypothetical protein [Reinekea marina]